MQACSKLAAAAVLAVLLGSTTACSGKTVKETTTVVQTVIPSATAVPTDTESSSDPNAGSSVQTDDTGTESPTPTDISTGPVVIGPGRQGATLGLADFFDPSPDWSQDSYDVASRKGIQGISATVSGCASYGAKNLQLRLGDNYKTLSFSVGQANDSKSSDQTLVVDVFTNSRQVLSQKVPFNTIQSFTVPVLSVNAVILSFHLDFNSRDCGGSLNPVIFAPKIS
jgi:hypothetical protein